MTKSNSFTMDASTSKSILKGYPIIDDSAATSGVLVGNVTYTDKAGQQLFWQRNDENGVLQPDLDDNGNKRPRAIVNLHAITAFNASEAKALWKDGQFQEATNKNLTISLDVGKARLAEVVGSGTLRCREIENKDGISITVAHKFIPDVIKRASDRGNIFDAEETVYDKQEVTTEA